MKRTAILISTVSLLLSPTIAFAEVSVNVSNNEGSSHVSVSSQGSGTSTVCQNGTCTTTGGQNTSTVCVNGSCTTSNDNVHYESSDGTTKVEVNNEAGVQDSLTEAEDTITPTEAEPTATKAPENKIRPIHEEKEELTTKMKQRMKDQDTDLAVFIQLQMASLKELITKLF